VTNQIGATQYNFPFCPPQPPPPSSCLSQERRNSLDSLLCDPTFVNSKLDANMEQKHQVTRMTSAISSFSALCVLLSKNTPVTYIS
jgi:hypothetical protein